jgi:hypothetical protein
MRAPEKGELHVGLLKEGEFGWWREKQLLLLLHCCPKSQLPELTAAWIWSILPTQPYLL